MGDVIDAAFELEAGDEVPASSVLLASKLCLDNAGSDLVGNSE